MNDEVIPDEEYKVETIGPKKIEIPEHWTVHRLGDEEISSWITQGPNPDYSLGTPESSYRAIKTKDLYDDGVLYDNADKISKENIERRSKYVLNDGDVLIAIVGKGSIGKTHIFREKEDRDYIFTRAIGVVRPNPENILPEYLHHYFHTHNAKQHFNQLITGSTGQEVLRTSAIKAMGMPLPPIEEQRRIVDVLSTVDKQIGQISEYLEKTKEVKKGLLQDMLTGSVNLDKLEHE